MDLLWLESDEVVHAFEVESTTTMTSGLQRGSNLPASVLKTMVIPEDREKDFERKMKSPLFSEHFKKDNWSLAYFNTLREAFTKTKANTVLEALLGKKKSAPTHAPTDEGNGSQRLMDFGGPDASEPEGALESAAAGE
jgi:hypothetical protein